MYINKETVIISMNLMQKVLDYRNIHLAYLRVKNDYTNSELIIKKERELFQKCIPNIYEIIGNILSEKTSYIFNCLEQLNKPKTEDKDEWKTRPLVRINFFDAVIIQSVVNILVQEIKNLLPSTNFGFTILSDESSYLFKHWKNGYSKFIKTEIEATENGRYTHFLEADIENFYPSVDHDILITDLKKYIDINDSNDLFFKWINKILKIKVKGVTGKEQIIKGLPQGPMYSPIFAMFYIRDCFREIKKKYPRALIFGYVDDMRVYTETEEEANKIKKDLKDILFIRKLILNKDKTHVKEVDELKKDEVKLMGRASNLNRAIRDEVILNVNGKELIKLKLLELVNEVSELYSNENEKFKEKIKKFVDYRIVKILEDKSTWYEYLDEFIDKKAFKTNFVAIWHALFLGAETFTQKRDLFDKFVLLFDSNGINDLTYVKFLCLSYIFKFSPIELRLSDEYISEIIDKYTTDNNSIFLKAVFSKINKDWIGFLNKKWEVINTDDPELLSILYSLGLIRKLPFIYNFEDKRLVYFNNKIISKKTNLDFDNDEFLEDEKIKKIIYKKVNYNCDSNGWEIEIEPGFYIIKDLKNSLSDKKSLLITKQLFEWLYIQIKISQKRIPVSVVHPEYIWINQIKEEILIVGNPSFQEDIFYTKSPDVLWRKTLIELFIVLFKIEDHFSTLEDLFKVASLKLWQYRIIRGLLSRFFKLDKFIEFVLQILQSDKNQNYYINYGQMKLDHLMNHYISNTELQDKLLQISIFVEDSWKNGAKECNLFTLHNHEHAQLLIYKIHELFEKTGFSIYLNSKEAFRLFSACYLHDISMLSEPSSEILYDSSNEYIQRLRLNISNITNLIDEKFYEQGKLSLELFHIYDIFSEVEKVRESIVRDKHPFISEKELVSDYPLLPLTIAERRDIGIISAGHGKGKSDINKIDEILYDIKHPIRLRLLALLLRFADLCDVSNERVTKEVIERNYKRMSNVTLFHWIKHLSVNRLFIEEGDEDNIHIVIEHSYLPFGGVDTQVLKEFCGEKCKIKMKDSGLSDFYNDGLKGIQEKECFVKYFNQECNITCAFINEAYRWFFAEIIFLNGYFKKYNIDVKLDLSIRLTENNVNDFNVINNRNTSMYAQEFMMKYFTE